MINKNATNAVRIVDGDFFARSPPAASIPRSSAQPGVVSIGNTIIRGGRQDESGIAWRASASTTSSSADAE